MKKINYLMAMLFFCIIMFNSMLVQAQIRVVCVGNSITEGVGTSNSATKAYPVQLGTLLGSKYKVLNCGVSGRTMLKKGDAPYWNEIAYTNAKNFDPQIVIISLGTNDSKPWNWVNKASFYADYTAMVAEFRKNGKNPHIFVCAPPPAFIDNYGIRDSIIRNDIMPIVDSVRRISGTSRIDFYNQMLDKGDYFPDGIHPNDDGAKIMAQIAYKTITSTVTIPSVVAPRSNYSLSNNNLTITVNNNYGVALTKVPVAYQIDDNAEIKDTIVSIPAFCEVNFTFAQKADLSAAKAYVIKVYTSVDSLVKNDTIKTNITNFKPKADLALNFEGHNGRVQIPHSANLMPKTALTIEAWVYPTAFRSNNWLGTVVSKEEAGSKSGYVLSIGGNGQGRFAISDGLWKDAVSPVGSIVLNKWQHMAGVYDGASIKLYINGVLKATFAVNTIKESTSDLCIGQTSLLNTDYSFIGAIDEVRVWNKAFTVTQIAETKDTQLWGNETGIVAYYKFNDGIGKVVVGDSTGRFNDGIIKNMKGCNSWVAGAGLSVKSGSCPIDVALSAIIAPKTGIGLDHASVTIKVFNIGNTDLLKVPVSYKIDAGNAITDTIPSAPAHTYTTFTFNQKADFAQYKDYLITASTNLAADTIVSNNVATKNITNFDPKGDYALVLSGSKEGRANIPHSTSLMPTKAITIEAWVYPLSFRANVWEGSVISKEGSGTGYALNIGGNGQCRVVIGVNNNWYEAAAPVLSIPLKKWTHIAGVYDGATLTIYVNGTSMKSTKIKGSISTSTNNLYFGASPAFGSREFNGGIDEVRIWNIALAEADIKYNKDYFVKGNEPGLVAYYKCNEGIGATTIIDSTGAGKNGVIEFLDTENSWMIGAGLGVKPPNTAIQLQQLTGVQVFPNPANDFITVKCDNSKALRQLVLSDMSGRIVYTSSLSNSESTIDVRNFTPGVYALTVSTGGRSATINVLVK